eukprot:TRINITY_DN2449_c0_g1_i6.p3 TRINITY_DN2449_c0_g1~~TRINITY_DN2449_c0_g1_i6.p3  ORF type:complete len:124 (+),score=4.84 TRINITY_DN2449_c0_g1_i6:97-468(+)
MGLEDAHPRTARPIARTSSADQLGCFRTLRCDSGVVRKARICTAMRNSCRQEDVACVPDVTYHCLNVPEVLSSRGLPVVAAPFDLGGHLLDVVGRDGHVVAHDRLHVLMHVGRYIRLNAPANL